MSKESIESFEQAKLKWPILVKNIKVGPIARAVLEHSCLANQMDHGDGEDRIVMMLIKTPIEQISLATPVVREKITDAISKYLDTIVSVYFEVG